MFCTWHLAMHVLCVLVRLFALGNAFATQECNYIWYPSFQASTKDLLLGKLGVPWSWLNLNQVVWARMFTQSRSSTCQGLEIKILDLFHHVSSVASGNDLEKLSFFAQWLWKNSNFCTCMVASPIYGGLVGVCCVISAHATEFLAFLFGLHFGLNGVVEFHDAGPLWQLKYWKRT